MRGWEEREGVEEAMERGTEELGERVLLGAGEGVEEDIDEEEAGVKEEEAEEIEEEAGVVAKEVVFIDDASSGSPLTTDTLFFLSPPLFFSSPS